MNNDSLQSSYAACRRLVRRSHSNFTRSFLLLRPEKRRAMDALYAFMRHTDDLGDSALSSPERRKSLAVWRAALTAALHEQPLDDATDTTASRLLPAVCNTVRRFGIPIECLHDAIDGQEMDLDVRQYETFDELAVYCQKVASAVGVACLHIWGFRTHAALVAARQCGIAMQLTNILRDLRADAALGRCYLPQADMRACGYSCQELREGQVKPAFRRLVELESDRAESLYHASLVLLDELAPDGLRPFRLMIATYHALLEEIRCRAGELLHRPVHLSGWRKARITLRCLLRPGVPW